MALFSKPPAKKPSSARAAPAAAPAKPHAPSAHEVASEAAGRRAGPPTIEPAGAEITGASLIDWSPAQQAIEVGQANPGLCNVLENAALLFANGQANEARLLLEDGLVHDEDAKTSALAWLALFDLLQRAGDKAAFDQLALQYVVRFERSAPMWEDMRGVPAGPRMGSAGGYVGVTGKLGVGSAAQMDAIRRLGSKGVAQPRLDLSSVTGFDDEGARLLADALATVRRQQVPLRLERFEKLRAMLDAAVMRGREGGEGAWLLSLELRQWQNDQAGFDDRAVEYAVTFELSPPSWEPPAFAPSTERAASEHEPEDDDATQGDAVAWSGVITGTAAHAIAQLNAFAESRPVVPLDISKVERIDFVGAGSLLNAINRIEQQRRTVQIMGATPIMRALLLLLGISPRHFVRKVG